MTEIANMRFDPSTVSATIEVLEKGEYEFKVTNPKSFLKKSGEGDKEHDSYGIRYTLTVTDSVGGKADGKKVFYSTYYQSEGGQAMAKGFMMACLGYGKSKDEERRFDADMAGADWDFNPADGSVGDAYKKIDGTRVIGQLDVGKNNRTDEPMQNFKSFRSIQSGPLAK